jgi:peptide/nickel transport system permease protein
MIETLRLITRRPAGLIGLVGVVLFAAMSYLGPLVVGAPSEVNIALQYKPPSPDHLLGTDYQGRDVLAQIVNGGRDLLTIALLTALFSTSLAVSLGALSATIGGRFDAAMMAVTDVGLTIPDIVVLVVIAAILRPTSFVLLALILALLQCWFLLRLVRAQILSLKEREYVEAARSLDLGVGHIVFREMLPNMRGYIAIHFILAMTAAIYAQTGIILLGLLPLEGTSWGLMLYFANSQGAIFFRDSFWYIFSPIAAIALFQLCLVSLARGLEDVFDPRLRAA